MIIKLDPPKPKLEKIAESDLSVVMVYADGCRACISIKPIFTDVAEKYQEKMTFFSVDINHAIEFYNSFAEKDSSGEVKYIIPTFLIFHKENQTDDNPLGFIGGIDGSSPEELLYTLEMLENEVLD